MTTTSSYFTAYRGGRDAAGPSNHGLHVQLLWRPHDDDVTVIVDDPASGIIFAGSVARESARNAFDHLFDVPNPAVVSTVAPRRGRRGPGRILGSLHKTRRFR